MRSHPHTVVAASAALCSVALLGECVVGMPAEVPSIRFSRRLQVGTPYVYSSPAPVFPAAAPIPPAPIVLRPVVAPLIQGTLWRMHNGLAAASNSLLGTGKPVSCLKRTAAYLSFAPRELEDIEQSAAQEAGIPYAGPLDTGVQVAFAPGSLPSLSSADAFQGPYRDNRNFFYEGNPNAAGGINITPGRDHFNYEESLGHATGDFLYDPYKPRALPLPPPHNPDYPLNEQLLRQAQQRLQSSNGGQQQNPSTF